jgi:hypothetical protein
MTILRSVFGAGLALTLASTSPLAQAAQAAPPAQPAPAAAATDTAPAEVEPEAVQALTRMSAYLTTLVAFDIKADTSLDLVLDDGEKVKLGGVTRYIVRRPDAFVVDMATDWKVRRLIYDGKSLTLSAPELGYYAKVDAQATIRETLDAANERYGLRVPLQDLFRWMDPARNATERLTGAMVVGPAKVDGVETDHYAFREDDVDWQVWIQKGDRPAPLKVVITDRLDPTHPQYEARLHWNTSPALTSNTFTFRPDKNASQIRLTSLKP